MVVEEISSAAPVVFPTEIQHSIKQAADARGYPNQAILSCAGHDARHLAGVCPSGMVFVPCLKGISHNEAERSEPEHVAAGAQIVCDVVTGLACEY